MLTRMFVQNTVWLIIMGALLFVPAGTLDWVNAWLFMLILIITGYSIGIWLAKYDPALLKERLTFLLQHKQQKWTKF